MLIELKKKKVIGCFQEYLELFDVRDNSNESSCRGGGAKMVALYRREAEQVTKAASAHRLEALRWDNRKPKTILPEAAIE